MSRLLRVNMTDRTTTYEEVPEHYRHWGGRGLTSMVIAREVPPTCHPLGPNNKLVIAPGIVSGTAAPTSGRTAFGGKSPLTGTIKESNAGGLSSQQIARLGLKGLVVEGHPREAG
ncbi:MAG TPA: aldehyde ferredoxin oxidoreductase, partial [Candidatus Rokubacteria bacterium]|nr:aldehyde ferredoxin oxidoreductase [Candidatus Rokubacteria bacterium]